jgi:hypothetical protein
MAVTVTQNRGTTTAMTITLASLAFSATAGRESTAVDNSSTLAVDYDLGGFITTGTTPTAGNLIEVWCYGSYDGTSYIGGASGTDAALTPVGTKSLMRLIQAIPITGTSNVKYTWQCGSVANLFGGLMPVKFGIWVLNNTAVNLNATGGNHEAKYTAIKYVST